MKQNLFIRAQIPIDGCTTESIKVQYTLQFLQVPQNPYTYTIILIKP